MTKGLYSTEQVLDALVSDDEDFALDDEDEPMMVGSDDEFSDLEAVPDNHDDEATSTLALFLSPC